VRSLQPADPDLARAAERLDGSAVLVRMGMGVMKNGMPRWLANIVPDAPSIAMRLFSASGPDEIRIHRRLGEDLDLLCTAGGDRLWKLVLNLATGGKGYGLRRFDYFENIYYADVPYQIGDGALDIWIRLVPSPDARHADDPSTDAAGREERLSRAVTGHAAIQIEVQRAGSAREPFVPIAEMRFEEEIQIDQETLHFDPVAGRGFAPHGFLTDLRRRVYPASVQSRPHSKPDRERRESDGLGTRLVRFLGQDPSTPLEGGDSAMNVARGNRWLRIALLAIVAMAIVFGLYMAIRLTRDRPVRYADDVLHFKHGSTGGERTMGIPYWFWVALPELFPEYLPDHKAGRGYKSFGMIYENGEDPRYALPVGVSMRNFRGIDVVYLNCAVCHTGSVRDAPGAAPRVVAGMPANTFDLGAFEKFLTSIPLDQKFVPQRVLDQIDAMQDNPNRRIDKPDFINRQIFKYYAVYLMREKMLMLRQRLDFIHAETWGPGRVDTFNAPKALLNFNMTHADERELMGNADFPSIWNQGPREGMQLHWDGNNTSVNERNLSAAFGTGAYPPTLDAGLVLRTARWLLTATPPGYPYPIDPTLVQQGAPIYKEYCARCHGTREAPYRSQPRRPDELVGTVIPIEDIGTDRSRLDSYTYLVAANQSTLYAGYEKDWGFDKGYPERFSHFHKTQGYANAPLDGIWLRAPYLHNGSVPNLAELLEPSAMRTTTFYRGNDVYDPQRVGFVSNVAEQDGTTFFRFNTAERGNGNLGHQGRAYGTDLPAAQKRALLEYLKTF
jgi:mono/diheme cytochrome c family protein